MEHILSSCGVQALESTGSIVAVLKLSCSKACGVLVSPPGTESVSPALQGRLLNTGKPDRSQRFSVCYLYFYSFFCSYDDSLLVAFSFFSSSSFLSTTNSFSITLVFLFHPWVCVPAISSWFIGTVSILRFFEPRDNCMTFLWFTENITSLCALHLPFVYHISSIPPSLPPSLSVCDL